MSERSRRSRTPTRATGPTELALLREGLSAAEVVDRLTSADEDRAKRQLGIVDALGRAARSRARSATSGPAGVGTGYAAQGNILVSAATVDALAETFEATAGSPLAERLLDSLAAAQEAGGDRRGQQSAALLVVERDGGYAGLSDVLVDLRIDDHERPVDELRRIFRLHQALFGTTPRAEWIEVDDTLRAEIDERLARLGYERLEDWAGVENLEERVDGVDAVDPVLEALREALLSGYEVTRLDDVPELGSWRPVRRHLGIGAFGINAWTGGEGAEIIGAHDEKPTGHEELYLVLAGRARFTVGDETFDADTGTIVFVSDPDVRARSRGDRGGHADPDRRRQARRAVPAAAVGGERGDLPAVRRGPLRRGEGAPGSPGGRVSGRRAGPLYNLACAEAQLGEHDAALEHLCPAVELEPRFIALAREDADFASIREDDSLPGSPRSRRVAGRPRRARGTQGTGSWAGRATTRTAPCSGPASASTSRCRPAASANALCACSPPNGTTSSARAAPAMTAPQVTALIATSATSGRPSLDGTATASGPARQRRPAGWMREPTWRGRGQHRRQPPRSRREQAAPSSRASRSGSSAPRPRL